MVDLVAARAAGVLSAFNHSLRVAPDYPGDKTEVRWLKVAWFSGYDAEAEFQDQQLTLPMGNDVVYNPRSLI